MPLGSAIAKLDWASGHLETLWQETTAYLKGKPYEFVADPKDTFERDGDTWASGRFVGNEAILTRLSFLFGDVVTNLRCSLDYLVWELVRVEKNTPGTASAFPICDSVQQFGSELQKGRLGGVNHAVVSHIESLQPYHSGKQGKETFLWMLNEFCNMNKHRRVLGLDLSVSVPSADFEIEHMPDGSSYARVNPAPKFKSGAKVGPYRIVEGEPEIDHNLMGYVAIQEPPIEGFEVCSLVDKTRDYVRQEILKFDKFF
jgi:hypothetical protein